MAKIQDRLQEKAIREAILTSVIPTIKRKLRIELSEIFNQQVQNLINDIGSQFEEKIAAKKEAVLAAQNEMKNRISDINSRISLYNGTLDEIKSLADTVLFSN